MTATRPILFAAAVAAAPLASPAVAVEVQMSATNPVVELSVAEQVMAAPDVAVISTGVQTKAPTASEAMRLNAVEMDRVIARIRAQGVAEKDIQTSGISLNADYVYDNNQPPRFVGYQVSNSVTLKIRDLKRLGTTLDALVAAGATNLNGPTFMIDDDSKLVATARERAFARGLAQARSYARAAGYADVRLLSVNEGISGNRPMPMEARLMMSDASLSVAKTPVAPGEVASGVNVSFTYEMTR